MTYNARLATNGDKAPIAADQCQSRLGLDEFYDFPGRILAIAVSFRCGISSCDEVWLESE
jgi:hypothetical protein